jgi:precorrin-2 methylase
MSDIPKEVIREALLLYHQVRGNDVLIDLELPQYLSVQGEYLHSEYVKGVTAIATALHSRDTELTTLREQVESLTKALEEAERGLSQVRDSICVPDRIRQVAVNSLTRIESLKQGK